VQYPLAGPDGIAVNLPHARSVLALGVHRVRHRGLRSVWIRAHERGGIQVRFTLAPRPDDDAGAGSGPPAAAVEDGVIKLRLPTRTR
jgi:hypothetical protein